jgi:RNA polymerase sigma factor (sigma-70 family)
MTDIPATDAELILEVRAGDAAAYEELFRRHRDVALRYARRLSDAQRGDDLVAEAFTKILDLLQRGKGPDLAFRAYLLTTVRTCHLNSIRAGSREELVPDHEPASRSTPVIEDPDSRFDRSTICDAFTQLPVRWQSALWLTTVEGLSNEEAGERLGIGPNAVASLAFRARTGLRQAFLAEHLQEPADPHCRRVTELLPSHLRGTLTPRRRRHVDDHLAGCRGCTAAYAELSEVDTRLGALLAPLALAGFTVTAGSGAVGGFAGLHGAAATAAKVAVAASVAAVGITVGTRVLTRAPDHAPRPSADHSAVATETLGPHSLPVPTATSTSGLTPGASIVLHPPTGTDQPAAVPGLDTDDTGPSDQPTPEATSPTSPPATGTPAAPAVPPARAMAVGELHTTRFVRDFGRWNRVSVPVSNPPKDAILHLVTTKTLAAELVTPTTSGWVCGTPKLTWNDGAMFAKTVTDCIYNGHGDGSALLMEYQVGGGSRLRVTLTPPPTVADTSSLDNTAELALLS